MTVTVSTSLDGVTPPAVDPDLASAIQAARYYQQQSLGILEQMQVLYTQVNQLLTVAQSQADQAAAVLNATLALINSASIGVNPAALPTTLPSTPNKVWNNKGFLAVS